MRNLPALAIAAPVLAIAAAHSTPALAQVRPYHAIVATALPGGPATALIELDLVTGLQTPLGRFAADSARPRAVAISDDGALVVVAVDAAGNTDLVELQLAGSQVIGETRLAVVPGRVTDLIRLDSGAVIASTGGPSGALFRVAAGGGAAVSIASMPRATAMQHDGLRSSALVLQSGDVGPPVIEPSMVRVDLTTGQRIGGAVVFAGFRPVDLTGVHAIPSAVDQQLITTAAGTVGHTIFGGPLQAVAARPALPPGATTAIAAGAFGWEAIVLGDASHPFVQRLDLDFAGGGQWAPLAGPIAGDPVDLAIVPFGAAAVTTQGSSCGGPRAGATGGRPYPGNASFAMTLAGARAGAATLFVLGIDDQSIAGAPLPLALPGGCALRVAPLLAIPHVTSATGDAAQALPIPNLLDLRGGVVFGQWLQATAPAGFATSDAIAAQIGV